MWLTSCVPFFALVGAFSAGKLSQLGRKIAFILTDILGMIGVLVCMLGLNELSVSLMITGRVI